MGLACLFLLNGTFQGISYATPIYQNLATNTEIHGPRQEEVDRAALATRLLEEPNGVFAEVAKPGTITDRPGIKQLLIDFSLGKIDDEDEMLRRLMDYTHDDAVQAHVLMGKVRSVRDRVAQAGEGGTDLGMSTDGGEEEAGKPAPKATLAKGRGVKAARVRLNSYDSKQPESMEAFESIINSQKSPTPQIINIVISAATNRHWQIRKRAIEQLTEWAKTRTLKGKARDKAAKMLNIRYLRDTQTKVKQAINQAREHFPIMSLAPQVRTARELLSTTIDEIEVSFRDTPYTARKRDIAENLMLLRLGAIDRVDAAQRIESATGDSALTQKWVRAATKPLRGKGPAGAIDLGMTTDGGEGDVELKKEINAIGHDRSNRVLEAACEHLTRENIADLRNSLPGLRAKIFASLRRSSATHLMGEVTPAEALVRNKEIAESRNQDYEEADDLLISVAWGMAESGNTGVTQVVRDTIESLKEAKRVGCRITHQDLHNVPGTGRMGVLTIADRAELTGEMRTIGAAKIDLSVNYSRGDEGILQIGQLNFKFNDAENSITILSSEGSELLRIAGDASYEALSDIAKSACEGITVILTPGIVTYSYVDGNNGQSEEFAYLTKVNRGIYRVDGAEINNWEERRKGSRNNIVTVARLAVMTARAVNRDESPKSSDAPSVDEFFAKLDNPRQFFESSTDLGMTTHGGEEKISVRLTKLRKRIEEVGKNAKALLGESRKSKRVKLAQERLQGWCAELQQALGTEDLDLLTANEVSSVMPSLGDNAFKGLVEGKLRSPDAADKLAKRYLTRIVRIADFALAECNKKIESLEHLNEEQGAQFMEMIASMVRNSVPSDDNPEPEPLTRLDVHDAVTKGLTQVNEDAEKMAEALTKIEELLLELDEGEPIESQMVDGEYTAIVMDCGLNETEATLLDRVLHLGESTIDLGMATNGGEEGSPETEAALEAKLEALQVGLEAIEGELEAAQVEEPEERVALLRTNYERWMSELERMLGPEELNLLSHGRVTSIMPRTEEGAEQEENLAALLKGEFNPPDPGDISLIATSCLGRMERIVSFAIEEGAQRQAALTHPTQFTQAILEAQDPVASLREASDAGRLEKAFPVLTESHDWIAQGAPAGTLDAYGHVILHAEASLRLFRWNEQDREWFREDRTLNVEAVTNLRDTVFDEEVRKLFENDEMRRLWLFIDLLHDCAKPRFKVGEDVRARHAASSANVIERILRGAGFSDDYVHLGRAIVEDHVEAAELFNPSRKFPVRIIHSMVRIQEKMQGTSIRPELYLKLLMLKAFSDLTALDRTPHQSIAEQDGINHAVGEFAKAPPLVEEARQQFARQGRWAKSYVASVRAELATLKEQGKRLGIVIDATIGNLGMHARGSEGLIEELRAMARREGFENLDVFIVEGQGHAAAQIEKYIEKHKGEVIVRGVVREMIREDDSLPTPLEKLAQDEERPEFKEKVRLVAVNDTNVPNADPDNLYYFPILPMIQRSLTGTEVPIPHTSVRAGEEGGIIMSIINLELPETEPIDSKLLKQLLEEDAAFVNMA